MMPSRSKLVCDFNDGTPCTALADNVGIDETAPYEFSPRIVCERHACALANDTHMKDVIWFKLEGEVPVCEAPSVREAKFEVPGGPGGRREIEMDEA